MFQVWYGQEARMYSWLLAAGVGSTWFLWRMLPHAGRTTAARWPAWIGYVLCTAGAVYMHIYGFLLPVAQTAFMLLWLALTRDRRGFARWIAAGAAVLLLYLPWLPRFLGIFGFPGWRQGLDPLALPWRYLAACRVSREISGGTLNRNGMTGRCGFRTGRFPLPSASESTRPRRAGAFVCSRTEL
jgi:uncharacterized membrane protein